MSSFKRFAWSGAAVVFALVLSLGLMAQTVSAAPVTVVVGLATANLGTNPVNGTSAFTTLATAPKFTETATGDIATGTNTATLTAPTGWSYNTAATLTTTNVGADITSSTATVTSSTVITLSVVAAAGATTDSVQINGIQVRPDTTLTATGSGAWAVTAGTIAGLPAATGITLTTSALTTATTPTAPYKLSLFLGNATTCLAAGPTSLPADGSLGAALCAVLLDSTGAAVPSVAITFTVSSGVVSTGTAKTVAALTNASGLAATNYRGGGNVSGTDSAVASQSQLNVVATLSITLTSASGTTASKIVFQSPSTLAVAAQVTNSTPNYQSPTTGTAVSFQVQDASGLGVNTQVILITVDKGAVYVNAATGTPATVIAAPSCASQTAKSVTVTTSSQAQTNGGTVAAGVGNIVYCANQLDAAGKATITGQNITTSMANATQSISMAGRPSKITATATGGAISVQVTDAGGNAVADGTPVRFTMSSNAGAVSTACTTTTNGAASAVASLIAATGNVIVSSDWNETGSAATCTGTPGAGAQQIAANVSLPGGTSTAGGTTPPAGGAGSISSGSVPAAGGFGLIVASGDIKGVVTASGCPAASAAFWATVNGNFVTYVPGTSITAVNADFMTAFPGGILPAATPLIAKCK